MKFFITLLLFFFSFTANAQETVTDTLSAIVEKPTIEPEFPGGKVTFHAYISTAFNRNNIYVPGGVDITFVIEKDGRVTNVEVANVHDKVIREKIIKVFHASPKWKPGFINGEPVRAQYHMPITFNP